MGNPNLNHLPITSTIMEQDMGHHRQVVLILHRTTAILRIRQEDPKRDRFHRPRPFLRININHILIRIIIIHSTIWARIKDVVVGGIRMGMRRAHRNRIRHRIMRRDL
jgi:uncharacterized protein YqiB (DUF1249 family)